MSISTMTTNLTANDFVGPILDGINHVVPKLPEIVFGVVVGALLIALLSHVLKLILTVTVAQVGLRSVIVSVVKIILWLFLIIKTLEALGFDNIVVFFSGSIAALGLAMAAGGSTLISDIIAGLFLARDLDFNVGDEVKVGEGPTQGIIESMDARRVRVRDDEGVLHVIPNSVVERKEWIVLHRKNELNGIARAAQRLRAVAVEKAADRRAAAGKRQVNLRKYDQ